MLLFVLLFMFFEVLEEDIDRHDDGGTEDGLGEHPYSTETSYSGGTPYRCGGRQAFDRISVLEDDTGTQETDTGHHLRDDTGIIPPKIDGDINTYNALPMAMREIVRVPTTLPCNSRSAPIRYPKPVAKTSFVMTISQSVCIKESNIRYSI